MPKIDVDDIMNAVYAHVGGDDRPIKWECEGCGDDSRDGYKLAVKEIQALLDKHYENAKREMRVEHDS